MIDHPTVLEAEARLRRTDRLVRAADPHQPQSRYSRIRQKSTTVAPRRSAASRTSSL